MTTMRRVLVERIGSVVTVSAPRPSPPAGWVLVQTTLAGICGSDTHAVAGQHPSLPPPYCPGHEGVGLVAEVGAGVSGLVARQRVILKPNVNCTECVNCRAGRTNACQELNWIGCDPTGALPGAMAEYFLAPARNLYHTPVELSDEQAVLVECLATPLHAARMAGSLVGARVAVLGAGTIGLLSVLAARWLGAAKVVATDLDVTKRERARRHGATAALDPRDSAFSDAVRAAAGGPIDVVFDCVVSRSSLAQALGIVRRAATILIVGVPATSFEVPMPCVQDWELRIQGCASYHEADFAAAVAAGSQIPAQEIITGRFDIADAAGAFAQAAANSSGKVVLGPAGSQH